MLNFGRDSKVPLEVCKKRKCSTKVYFQVCQFDTRRVDQSPIRDSQQRICRLLQVESGRVLLRLRREAVDDDDEAIETGTGWTDFYQWDVSTMECIEAIPGQW